MQVHIVYLGEQTEEKALKEIEDTHHSFLLSVKGSEEEARASLLYSYKNSINGFAALLTPEEALKLSGTEIFQMGSSCSYCSCPPIINNHSFQ